MNAEFRPVAIRDRIQTLDVVRGFALLGIALMNVEFFNRPIGDLDAGLPLGATGPLLAEPPTSAAAICT